MAFRRSRVTSSEQAFPSSIGRCAPGGGRVAGVRIGCRSRGGGRSIGGIDVSGAACDGEDAEGCGKELKCCFHRIVVLGVGFSLCRFRAIRLFLKNKSALGEQTAAAMHFATAQAAPCNAHSQNAPFSFRPTQKTPSNKTMRATVAQWDQRGMRFSKGRGSGRASISLMRSGS